MSIIQQIREKAAWLVFGLIALSLIGFLLMDAFVGRSRMFGNRSTVVGTVNGENIEYNSFQKSVSAMEQQYKSNGYPMNEMMQQNIRENVWRQIVEDQLLTGDEAALGLQVTDKEINDMLVGPNAIPQIKQAFTDPKTGVFNEKAAAERIGQLRNLWKTGPKKNTDPREYEFARGFFDEQVPQIAKMRMRDKYLSLLANSAYVPKWMLEKGNADNSQVASISYVNAPYYTIVDSTVKVSDAEINDYINAHKDQFHQEESRSIAYVAFDASPTAADSANLRQQLTDMKPEFEKSATPENFLARMGSEQQYFDGYKGKSQIMVPNKDSIFALAKGQVFGPYLDAGSYVIAKKIDEKILPDSVRARHILVGTADRNGQQLMPDSLAKAKIDSIRLVLEHGGNWDSVALKASDDEGSKVKGGDLGYFASGTMVKEFNDFAFDGKKGDKKVVKTQFGYHYMEILDQKNFEPAYKVAYMSKRIEPSSETDQRVSGIASQFSGENRDAKAFNEAIQKNNYQKLLAPNITPSEFSIPGIGDSRSLVRWIYEGKVGEVSEPFPVGDKYIVATIAEINNEGLMSAARARMQVAPILQNKKKAEMLMKKLGTPASLDAAATAVGQSVQRADSVLFNSPMLPNNGGMEPKVVGSAFNKALAGKPASQPIAGNGGVFVIKVENVGATSNANADLQAQRFGIEQNEKNAVYRGFIESLRKLATVKDNRGKFY